MERLEKKMEVYGNNWEGVKEEKVVEVEKRAERNRKEVRRREKVVKDVMKELVEMTGMKMERLMEEMGVEMAMNI